VNKKKWLVGLALLCNVGVASAQETDLEITAGVRAWWTQWTTFYYVNDDGNRRLGQNQASDELVLMPNVSLRYGKFSGSISAFPSTGYSFFDDPDAEREEFDLSAGYAVTSGLTVTLGYKQVEQGGSQGRYRPRGPVVGLNAYAPLGGLLALYGYLGLGRFQTPGGDEIDYKSDYQLAELGLGYTPNTAGRGRWTFTGGYRIQILDSKDALPELGLDARDTTAGFTLGANYTF
jgi:hypothetical protein